MRPPDLVDLFAVATGWWGASASYASPPGRVTLTATQRDGAATLARRIHRDGGALLADATGLGKSHIALDVADRLERRPFVIAPAHLRRMWLARAPDASAVVSHTKLSRVGPQVDASMVPDDALLIVDEAHRFRTPTTRRYAALARLVLRAPVLLVTATPLVSGVDDLRALLSLFVPPTLLPADDSGLAAVLAARTVRRVRSDVIGAAPRGDALTWRERIVLPPLRCAVPPEVLDGVEAAARAAMPLHGEPARLYASMLFARLASSPEAALRTVARARNYLVRLDEAARAGRQLDRRGFARAFGLDPDVQLAQTVMPFWYPSGPVADRVSPAAFDALATLEARLAALAAGPDARADRVRSLVDDGAVIVAFTSHVDTARAMTRRLRGPVPLVMLAGSGGWIGGRRVPLAEGVETFRRDAAGGSAVAVVTPVADEGIDLECADVAFHLDVPWTPAVVVQREGRLDRPGARRPMRVLMALPDPVLEARLGLLARVERRVDEADRMAVGVSRGRIPVVDAPVSNERSSAAANGLEVGPTWCRRTDRDAASGVLDWRGAAVLVDHEGPTIVLDWQGDQIVWAASQRADAWCVELPERVLIALSCVGALPRLARSPSIRQALDDRLWRAWFVARRPRSCDTTITRWLRIAARQATVRLACGDLAGARAIRERTIPTLRSPRTVGSSLVIAEATNPGEAAAVPLGPPRAPSTGLRSTTTWILSADRPVVTRSMPIRVYSAAGAPEPSP